MWISVGRLGAKLLKEKKILLICILDTPNTLVYCLGLPKSIHMHYVTTKPNVKLVLSDIYICKTEETNAYWL